MYAIEDIVPHLPVLHRRARNLCRHRADAEDLVSDTILRAAQFLASVRDNLRGWLLRIMFTVFRDRYKRGGGRRGVYLYDNPTCGLEDFCGPEDTVGNTGECSWELQHVWMVLDRVPEPFQRTLRAYVLGASDEELAAQEGVATQTIRSRINRARSHLRSLVGESAVA